VPGAGTLQMSLWTERIGARALLLHVQELEHECSVLPVNRKWHSETIGLCLLSIT
jgi:hypothetical protein